MARICKLVLIYLYKRAIHLKNELSFVHLIQLMITHAYIGLYKTNLDFKKLKKFLIIILISFTHTDTPTFFKPLDQPILLSSQILFVDFKFFLQNKNLK